MTAQRAQLQVYRLSIMAGNSNLHMSRAGKSDEFYTQISLIENELKYYRHYFKNKTVFCNCDDPEWSNFWRYFQLNFYSLGLRKLVSTHYEPNGISYKMEIVSNPEGRQIGIPSYVQTPLEGNGDFRSQECIDILMQSDIIVTNPPFSLFREYIAQLMEYKKDFVIIGNQNAVTYKEIFPLIKENEIWLGYNNGHFWFRVPDDYEIKKTDFKIDEDGQKWRRMGNICWYTNLDIQKRHEGMTLFRTYSPESYPKYDTYDAIEVSRTIDIPCDYYGVMGVPITFMDKYSPNQFEILGKIDAGEITIYNLARPIVNGKALYKRIAIRRKVEGA